ncbi:general transcription factor II-I repeat domain-containing protein 2 [Nephila pilipes]|uniref:General transcription factor II-I repeat domain-containing protein 2 n=1 Tax=Nephila pilipes TaxID=299642 RepID=A0A8X6UMC8_NEPPI|nr:general transcription factor II-I repeat domain-containing protein 2 [Nephila pilipes]
MVNSLLKAGTHASYIVVYNIAEKNKALSDEELVKQCMLHVSDVFCPGKKSNFELIRPTRLSRKMVIRFETIDKNLTSQLESKND